MNKIHLFVKDENSEYHHLAETVYLQLHIYHLF